MKFGPLPLGQAEGAILAHSVPLPGGRLRKGQVLDRASLTALAAAGYAQVTVAQLADGDVAEDAAANRLAGALVSDPAGQGLDVTPAMTGRVNLIARWPGVLEVDADAILRLNRPCPEISLATLPHLARVAAGQMCGTVKIISYSVAGALIDQACAAVSAPLRVRPVVLPDAGLILTQVPGEDPKLARKGRKAVEQRLLRLGMALAGVETVPHDEGAVAGALQRVPGAMVLILTGSATSDRNDTAPQALRRAGGQVMRFGMPVDPGNLLFLGHLGARPVIGLPGCARSPALNGADWVLERLACGIAVSSDDIAAMGVGGLLKDTPARGRLRDAGPE
jgi:molybdenum cofactor cytidylyltransferase